MGRSGENHYAISKEWHNEPDLAKAKESDNITLFMHL